MTLALYRKYRPRSFSEIIGQDHVTEPLSQSLRTGRLHHAYLFSGPRGCGKTSSARILARSLNCVKGPTPDPCGECESCRALAPDGPGSIDVIEIDAASHGGVDDARDLRERAFFAPVASRFKVYVIDEAHMVSSAGFNALLKLVEEPPDYVKFVFATTEPEKVLGTIKSRTHHYPFRLIPPGVLRPYLEYLCTAEGVTVEPAVFPLVVRAGGGSARDSLSVLDQLIAGAGSEGVTYSRAVALLGVTDVALLDEVCDALAAGDGAAVYATIHRVVEAGHDARRFAGDLLERLRNLIVLQQVPDAAAKGLIDGADDELARMTAQAERFGSATLSRMADIVHTGLVDMRGTTAPRLVLELIAARMLLPGAEDGTAALLARLERMERRLTEDQGVRPAMTAPSAPPALVEDGRRGEHDGGGSDAHPTPADAASSGSVSPGSRSASHPATSSASPTDSAPSTSSASSTGVTSSADATPRGVAPVGDPPVTVANGAASALDGPVVEAPDDGPASTGAPLGILDSVAVRRRWDEVITRIKRRSGPVLAAMVRDANVRDVSGSVVTLRLMHAAHLDRVNGSKDAVEAAIAEVFGGTWTVRPEIGDGAAPASPVRSGSSAARPGNPQTAAPAPKAPPAGKVPPAEGSSAPPTTTSMHTASPAASGPHLASTATSGAAAPTMPGAGGVDAVPESEDDGDDWPETARPGGAAAASPSEASTSAVAEKPQAPGKGSSGRAGSASVRGTQARSASGRNAAPRAAAKAGQASADEVPPYDPQYDEAPPEFGFDPGDEPLDDPYDGAPVSSGQQALDLLRTALGAEKIGD